MGAKQPCSTNAGGIALGTKTKKSRRPAALRMLGFRARFAYGAGAVLAAAWLYFWVGGSSVLELTTKSSLIRWTLILAPHVFLAAVLLTQFKASPIRRRSRTNQVALVAYLFLSTVVFFSSWSVPLRGEGEALTFLDRMRPLLSGLMGAAACAAPLAIVWRVMCHQLMGEHGELWLALRGWASEKGFRRAQRIGMLLCVPTTVLSFAAFDAINPLLWGIVLVHIPVSLIFLPAVGFVAWEAVKERPFYRRWFVRGGKGGGGARFGSVATFMRYDFTDPLDHAKIKRTGEDGEREALDRLPFKAPVFLGETMPSLDPKLGCRPIGLDSEQHLLTAGLTGGGKSVYAVWNVLPVWQGGAFVLDPDGKHWEQTREDRSRYGSCWALDFWEETPLDDWSKRYGGEGFSNSAHYNPLAEIDLEAITARQDLNAVINAVLPEEKDESANSKHFREMSHKVLMGYIVHVLTTFDEVHHTLIGVYDTILYGHPDAAAPAPELEQKLFTEMGLNPAVGGIAVTAAKALQKAGEGEEGGYRNTIAKALEWVKDAPFAKYMRKSSFRLRDIQNKKQTVYVVMDIENIRDYGAFWRILINQGFLACREEAPHDKRTLFVMDEFAQLDTFKNAKEGLVTLRKRGIKLWILVQHLRQLQDRYGSIEDFTGQCDVQLFGVNDAFTAGWASQRLGNYIDRWQEGEDANRRTQEHRRPLRTPEEVMEELRLKSGIQYLFPADGLPLMLRTVAFHKNFKDRTGYGKRRPQVA